MIAELVNDLGGTTAPPRSNGELVFTEPWQSSVFGITLGLCEAGLLDFEQFRGRLIARIDAAQDSAATSGEQWDYWQHWSEALEDVLDDLDLLTTSQIDQRAAYLIDETWAHDHAGSQGHAH